MKKNLFALGLMVLGLSAMAQSPRLSLYEEFTGENCGPCAQTNPGLNSKLLSATNYTKIVAIKWQVPIPSAPSATWSLYQTNKAEIDWRYRSASSGGYGYNPPVTYAPFGKIDGQSQAAFGATGSSVDHPANVTNAMIATAQSYTSAFTINMSRAWNKTCSAVIVTVNIVATAPYTTSGPLRFRTVMVEELVNFATAPGSNGEKTFESPAIKSFPTLQNGVLMANTWTIGQTQTFTLNCDIPSYARDKEEIAFVGFIQDDNTQKVEQAFRLPKAALPSDQVAALGAKVDVTCSNMITPMVNITNTGLSPLTSLSIKPYVDGVAGSDLTWTGSLAPSTSTTIAFSAITTPTATGAHTFSYSVSDVNAASVYNVTMNSSKVDFLVASSYNTQPVSEGFTAATFPPAGWVGVNSNGGPGWSRNTSAGGFNFDMRSMKYDFFNNDVIGDMDEMYLPPADLSGGPSPSLTFDLAYAMRDDDSNDKLEVFVSTDCGQNWSNVYSQSGMGMATLDNTNSPRKQSYNYIPDPTDPSHWRSEAADLTGFNKPNVLVKFVVTSDHGNNLYLDNINLSQADGVGIAVNSRNAFAVSVYPNPANGSATIRVTAPKATSGQVTIFNAVGQKVYSAGTYFAEGVNTVPVDLKGISAGMYNVVIDAAGVRSTNKLSVQ